MKKKTVKKTKWYEMDPKKHGMAGLSKFPIKPRKQDHRAKPWYGYAVILFPQYELGWKATIGFHGTQETLSQSAEGARVKYADRIGGKESPDKKWARYHNAGHRVRKVKIIDLGPV